MKALKWVLAVAGALLLAYVLFIYSHLPHSETVPLPRKIRTISEGYPIALEAKNHIAPDVNLAGVSVDLKRKRDGFDANVLNYIFASGTGKGRTITVEMVNARGKAFVTDHAYFYRHPVFPSWESQPLVVTQMDIPRVLEIANTNGLKEFSVKAPGESGTVHLMLGSSTNGAFWLVEGFYVGDREDVSELHLEIDARTGAVREIDTRTGAVRRQSLK